MIIKFLKNRVENYIMNRVPDIAIHRKNNETYLNRWYWIPRNRFFNIYIHEFLLDDEGPLHDHPWWSLSIMLSGILNEEYLKKGKHCFREIKQGDIIFRRAKFAHKLFVNKDIPTITLFITGPKLRTWGFHCLTGWISFTQYKDKGCD